MAETKDPLFLNKVRPNTSGRRTLSEELARLFFFYKKLDDEEKKRRIEQKKSAQFDEKENERRHQEILEALGKVTKQKEETKQTRKQKRAGVEEKDKGDSILKKIFGPETLAFAGGIATRGLQDLGILPKDEEPPTPPAPPEPEPTPPVPPVPEPTPPVPPVPEPTPPAPVEPSTPKPPVEIAKPQQGVLTDRQGQPVTDSSGKPILSGTVAPKPSVPATAQPVPTSTPTTGRAPTPVLTPAPPKPTAEKEKKGETGIIGSLRNAISETGITNPFAQNAILANIKKETNFVPQPERLDLYKNTSNERIREVFTSRVAKYSDAELNEIKKDPYKFGEVVYGKDTDLGRKMGNTSEGDGYKYRGRGYIQITGKNNYKQIGKELKIDLENNPDLLNDPVIALKASVVYLKNNLKDKLNKYTNQNEANRSVTQSIGGKSLNLETGIGAKLLAKVEKASEEIGTITTGTQLAQASIENKDLRQTVASAPPIIVNQTNNTIVQPPNKTVMVVSSSKRESALEMQQRG